MEFFIIATVAGAALWFKSQKREKIKADPKFPRRPYTSLKLTNAHASDHKGSVSHAQSSQNNYLGIPRDDLVMTNGTKVPTYTKKQVPSDTYGKKYSNVKDGLTLRAKMRHLDSVPF